METTTQQRTTPGPWNVTSDTERTGHVIQNADGFEVGLFVASGPTAGGFPRHNGYADARLIAAAPELLEAARFAVCPECSHNRCRGLRAAIAKAE